MMRTWFLMLLMTRAAAAAEPGCVPATEGAGVAALAEPWRGAVRALIRSTETPGQPWSCGGGVVDLRPERATIGASDGERSHGPKDAVRSEPRTLHTRAGAATLIVIPLGERPIEREVRAPEDVVPLGQALLAMPREVPPPPPAPPAPAVVSASPPPPPPTPPEEAPTFLLGVGLGPRWAGDALLGGEVSAALPLGAWLPALRLRYGRTDERADLAAGIGLARAFGGPALQLRAGLTLSAALLMRDGRRRGGDEVHIAPRLGAGASVVLPAWRSLRVVIGADGDATWQKAGSFPLSVGATLGVEVPL